MRMRFSWRGSKKEISWQLEIHPDLGIDLYTRHVDHGKYTLARCSMHNRDYRELGTPKIEVKSSESGDKTVASMGTPDLERLGLL
jgi:hypothetical protein